MGSADVSTADTVANVPGHFALQTPAQASMDGQVNLNSGDDASSEEEVIPETGNSGGNAPQPDDDQTDTDLPVDRGERKQKRRWRRPQPRSRTPSSEVNLGSHQTTETSISEYREGDESQWQGRDMDLPPLLLGKWTPAHGDSYAILMKDRTEEPYPCVKLPEAFLIDGVLPPQCTNQCQTYTWKIGQNRMRKKIEAFEGYRAFKQQHANLTEEQCNEERRFFRTRLTGPHLLLHDRFLEEFEQLRHVVLVQRNFVRCAQR